MKSKLMCILTMALMIAPTLMARPDAILPFGGDVLQVPASHTVLQNQVPYRYRGLQEACDRIVDTQCVADCGGKGIPWPLPPCPAPASVPGNTMGPAGMGLLYGYTTTNDINHLMGSLEFGNYAICYTYPTGEPRFATGTPYFLWYLTDIMPAATVFEEYARTEFFQALDDGTYGTGPHTLTSYLALIAAARDGDYINLRPYEMSDMLKGAYLIGEPGQFDEIACWTMQTAIETLDNAKWWDMLGAAAGVFGMAFANLDFDPQAGAWAAEDSIQGIMEALLAWQHPDGGFVWSTTLAPPFAADDEDLQATAYALLAMKALDPWYFADEITAAESWIYSIQVANGGFIETYTGAEENIQVDGEAIWALEFKAEPWNDGDVDDNLSHTPQDAQMSFQIYLQQITANFHEYNSADCDGDGIVSPGDALCIWEQYLGTPCSCEDPIITPPTCSKTMVLNPGKVLADGVITADITREGDQVTVDLNVVKNNSPIDSFGLTIQIPEFLEYRDIRFSESIQDWQYKGAGMKEGNLVMGGFDVQDSFVNGYIGSVTFNLTDTNSDLKLSFGNLVDDIQNFSIRVRIQNELHRVFR